MRELVVESLAARGFRNLASIDVALGPRFNVVHGDNGQGKTSLLEAIYLVATSRSFRTSKGLDVVTLGLETASVRARIVEDGQEREQSVGLRRGGRDVRVDGKRPATLGAYAVATPVVVFHSGSLALASGAGSERRRLLDRLSLYRDPATLVEAEAYARALRGRQRVLEARGELAADLEDWEELVVRHGAAVTSARQQAAAALGPEAAAAFARIGGAGAQLVARYAPSAPPSPAEYRAALVRDRRRDRARGSASTGPHRDDLVLQLGGRVVRGIASQGQHRAVVLAIELAEIALVAEARGVQPILLLDDVSSELDAHRMAALMGALGAMKGQVVITTTRPELIDPPGTSLVGARRDFHVVEGRVEPS